MDLPLETAPAALLEQLEKYVHANRHDCIAAGDLAAEAGMTIRSLQLFLRASVGVGPAAYLRELRLNGARRDLLRDGPAITVVAIARQWGFAHLGRFTDTYRGFFEQRPAETLRQARSARALGATYSANPE